MASKALTTKAMTAKAPSKVPSPKSSSKTTGNYDWGLLTIVATLLTLGVVMVFSASYTVGIYVYDDPFYFFFRQLMWLVVGIAAMLVTMRIPYSFWQRWSVLLMIGAFIALSGVIILGVEILGSTRTLLSGSVQPAEPAQIIIIVYVSAWLASKGDRIRNVQVGLIPFAVLMGIVTLLLVLQPKISTAVLIVLAASIMFFIAGAELRQLVFVGLGGTATFWLIIRYSSYAGPRIERYLAGISNPLESQEWQATRTLRAIVNGGLLGQGLGGGDYKMPGGVPLGWSDNIFAIIGEELGLLGTLLLILLFCLLIYRGLRTALRAPDTFGMLLATGITSLLALQALLNAAVALAIAPATGVTLPFISYGGSSLLTVMAAIGILLSISREADGAAPNSTDPQTAYARFNFGWGNGGHVYPALAVASQLAPTGPAAATPQPVAAEMPALGTVVREAAAPTPSAAPDSQPVPTPLPATARVPSDTKLLWVGSVGGMEQALVERAEIPYQAIDTGQLRGINPLKALANLGKMVKGFRQSLAILRDFRPDVCLVTGGYVCVPVVMACRWQRIPVLIYLPDMTPGAAILWLSRFAQRVAVSFPEAARFFGGLAPQGKAVVTGYPMRRELVEAAQSRATARAQLARIIDRPTMDGSDDIPLVLVWGGSLGSRSINMATWAALADLLPHAHVLHVVGQRDWNLAKEQMQNLRTTGVLSGGTNRRYHPVDYLHEAMSLALAAADLTVARAGASTLGEFPVAGLPAVLVPLVLSGVNQQRNAEQLVQHGAAVIVADNQLADDLARTVVELLSQSERRAAMAQAAKALAQPNAAQNIADLLVTMSAKG